MAIHDGKWGARRWGTFRWGGPYVTPSLEIDLRMRTTPKNGVNLKVRVEKKT